MALAYDWMTESHGGTTPSTNEASFNWSHNPVGVPKAVVVLTYGHSTSSDLVTGVSYASTALAAVPGGMAVNAGTEPGTTKLWFLGSGVPTNDPATIVVDRVNDANGVYAIGITLTALGDCEIVGIVLQESIGALAEVNVDDGSPGTNSIRIAAVNSGLAAIPAAGANSTTPASMGLDAGSRVDAICYETTPGQGSRPVGFSDAGSDDRAAIYFAVREIPAGGGSQISVISFNFHLRGMR